MSLSVRAEVTPVTLGMGVRVKLLPVLPVLPMNEWMSGNGTAAPVSRSCPTYTGGSKLYDEGRTYRMDTKTLNPACFGQGVTLADIEKLTLSPADLERLTFGKAVLADLAPPPLRLVRHEP